MVIIAINPTYIIIYCHSYLGSMMIYEDLQLERTAPYKTEMKQYVACINFISPVECW